jgi:hypothetical protein
MTMKRIIGLFTIFLLALSLASAPEKADAAGRDMGCSPTVANPCTGGSTGSGRTGNSSGGSIGTLIGNELGKALFGDPASDAKRKAEEQLRVEEQRRAEQETLRKHEEMKNRLLGGMMGVESSPQLGLMGVESGPGLSLMTDNASVNTQPAKGVPPAERGLQLMLDDDATRSSKQARQGFDTAGKIMGSNIPPPPPTPSISLDKKAEMLNVLKSKLKKNEAEEQSLKDQLAQLKQATAPDPVAINQVQEKIVTNDSEKKKIMLDLTADDPDAP